jgi:hypothetical protein
MTANPKLQGSNIVDAIPQTGECPNRCSECFYNGGRFYRSLDVALFPTDGEAITKIVRVNTGNDSNNQRRLVISSTEQYPNKFYNTAIPRLDFPAPVVLTINPQHNEQAHFIDPIPVNLMFVRVRVGMWDLEIAKKAFEHYGKHHTPVVMTFMRYYDGTLVPPDYEKDYEWKKHILNSYWCPKPEAIVHFMENFKGTGARLCGAPWSSFCVDCGNCETLYWRCKKRMADAAKNDD